MLAACFMLLEEEEDEEEEALMNTFHPRHRQDLLEGNVVNRRKPSEKRWWHREGRHLDSKCFYGLFRMM